MARKGWDALSDAYRDRLIRGGLTEAQYDAGVPLHGARGHVSTNRESFNKQTARFAKAEIETKTSRRGNRQIPERTESAIRNRVRAMGPKEGRKHMERVRKMTRLYESGDTDKARRMWEGRDQSQPEYMYFYHGVFGY